MVVTEDIMKKRLTKKHVRKNGVDAKFKKRVRRIMQKHDKTLRKLAAG